MSVIRARDFVRATADGTLDLGRSVSLLLDMVAAGRQVDNCEVMLDTRRARSVLTASELWTLASMLAEHRDIFRRRIAVLCPARRFQRAEFFALCVENKAMNVRAFVAYETAMQWLLEESTERIEVH